LLWSHDLLSEFSCFRCFEILFSPHIAVSRCEIDKQESNLTPYSIPSWVFCRGFSWFPYSISDVTRVITNSVLTCSTHHQRAIRCPDTLRIQTSHATTHNYICRTEAMDQAIGRSPRESRVCSNLTVIDMTCLVCEPLLATR
jgi:hypothetical protein